jgi:zinc transport system permease protein
MEGTNIITLLLTGGVLGAAAGYLGSFMVLKRMSLVGDALTHVALPGMALAFVFHVSPILGAFIALTIAVVGIWYFEETTQLYPEALLTPEPELLEALFGNIEKIQVSEAVVAIMLSFLAIILTRRISSTLVLSIISKDLVRSVGVKMKSVNLLYLLLVGLTVALGVKFVGTLLMGALVIIPAASAKNICRSMRTYQLFSAFFGSISAIGGLACANLTHIATGPLVVLISVALYLGTLVLKAVRRPKRRTI